MGSLDRCPAYLTLASLCAQEEEERKAQEEQARREHEEYLKLKEAFVVEEEGVGETMTEEQVGHCSWEAGETWAACVRPKSAPSQTLLARPWKLAGQLEPCSQNPRPSPWEALLLMQAGGYIGTQGGDTRAPGRNSCGLCQGDAHSDFFASLVPQLPDRIHQLH